MFGKCQRWRDGGKGWEACLYHIPYKIARLVRLGCEEQEGEFIRRRNYWEVNDNKTLNGESHGKALTLVVVAMTTSNVYI